MQVEGFLLLSGNLGTWVFPSSDIPHEPAAFRFAVPERKVEDKAQTWLTAPYSQGFSQGCFCHPNLTVWKVSYCKLG